MVVGGSSYVWELGNATDCLIIQFRKEKKHVEQEARNKT